MKKLLIVNNNLEVGGVQTSLVNRIKQIESTNEYDITLFLFDDERTINKDMLRKIPKSVHVVFGKGNIRALGMSQVKAKSISKNLALVRGLGALWSKYFSNNLPIKMLQKDVKKQKKLYEITHTQYDVAISYLHGAGSHELYSGCNEFVLNHVHANKKVTWIHCDYSNYQGNTHYNKLIVSRFDKIVCCSNGCRDSFLCAMNDMGFEKGIIENKTIVMYNLVDKNELLQLSKEYLPEEMFSPRNAELSVKNNCNVLRLLTVARLSEEKGILEALDEFNKFIKNRNDREYAIATERSSLNRTKSVDILSTSTACFIDVCSATDVAHKQKTNICECQWNGTNLNKAANWQWFIVGDGPLRKRIEDKIKEYGLEQQVILVGEKKNPYPYFKYADLLLVTSKHEAAPMIFEEASVFGLPIFSTDTTSAKELVENKGRGKVFKSLENLFKNIDIWYKI